jgi:hypothetical protein
MVILTIMEQRFELTNNEIEEIKQKLISTLNGHNMDIIRSYLLISMACLESFHSEI